jgi:hypothetical protein
MTLQTLDEQRTLQAAVAVTRAKQFGVSADITRFG